MKSTALMDEYFAVASVVSQELYYWLCDDPMCDDGVSRTLGGFSGYPSKTEVIYDPVRDLIVVGVLSSTSGIGQITLLATTSGDYTFYGMQETVSFSQTGWSGLSLAASPSGWGAVLMSSSGSYAMTLYICNTTSCDQGVNSVSYVAGKSTPGDFSVTFSPVDIYVAPLGSDYSGSFPILAITYSARSASVVFCLSLFCDKNTTATFGKSVTAISVVYGPDTLPVVHYIDSQLPYVSHCQNVFCNGTAPNNGSGYYAPLTNTFKVSNTQLSVLNAVSSSGVTLAIVESTNNDVYYTVPFCGPFIDRMSPTSGDVHEDTTLTVYGWSFCSNITSACKFGNLSVSASIHSSTELTCNVNFPNTTSVHVMVGSKDWSQYSYVPGSFEFSSHNHYPNAHKIGFTMITFIMATFFIVAFLTAFIYFRHSNHKRFEPPLSVRFNFYNLVTILSVPLEFVQLLAFSTSINAEWSHVIRQGASSFVLDFPSVTFVPIFFVVASVTFLWCLYVIPFLIRTSETLLVEKLQKSGLLRMMYTPAYIILIPFGTFLFFPVINTLLGMVSCEYWSSDHEHAVLAQDTGIACWYKEHIWYSVVAFTVFYSYFPLAIILHPRLQQISDEVDIKYDEKVPLLFALLTVQFLFIQSLLKLILCVVNAVFVEFELPRLAMVGAASFLLAIVATEMKPCNMFKLNSGLTTIYFGAFACAICSIWASYVSSDNVSPLLVLLLCWMLLGLFLLLSVSGIWAAFWKEKHTKMVNTLSNRNERTPLVLA